MALYGSAMTISYVCWNTSTNVGETGDVLNHTLRWIKDGTSAAPTNTPTEIDSVNAPGFYKITLTSTETQATYASLAGMSSTADVSIMPVSISFERLPNAAPGSNGGLPTVDASNHIAGVQGTLNVNASQISGDSVAADNLEAMLDGTGGVNLKLKQLSIVQTAPTESAIKIVANAAASAGITINATDAMGIGIILNTGLGTIDLDGSDIKTLLNTISTNVLINGTSIGTTISNTDTVEGSLATIDTEVGQLQTSLNTIAGVGFNASTDSLEAIRDQGDAAWTGAASNLTAADVRTEMDSNSTQLAGIKTKTDLITTGNISVTSPINLSGDITIVRGDDVTLPFVYTGADDLSTATVVFSALNKQTGVNDIDQAAAVVTGVVPAQSISVTLTNAQTKLLAVGEDQYQYDLESTDSGKITTLATGTMSVSKDVTGG